MPGCWRSEASCVNGVGDPGRSARIASFLYCGEQSGEAIQKGRKGAGLLHFARNNSAYEVSSWRSCITCFIEPAVRDPILKAAPPDAEKGLKSAPQRIRQLGSGCAGN